MLSCVARVSRRVHCRGQVNRGRHFLKHLPGFFPERGVVPHSTAILLIRLGRRLFDFCANSTVVCVAVGLFGVRCSIKLAILLLEALLLLFFLLASLFVSLFLLFLGFVPLFNLALDAFFALLALQLLHLLLLLGVGIVG